MKKHLRTAVCSLFFMSSPLYAADLELRIEGIRSDQGSVLVSLFDKAENFPSDAKDAFRALKIKAKKGVVTAHFRELPEGAYAIAFIHDENDNGRMDQNMIGIPKEGYGFGNNAKAPFGPPPYDKTLVDVTEPSTAATVNTKYF